MKDLRRIFDNLIPIAYPLTINIGAFDGLAP